MSERPVYLGTKELDDVLTGALLKCQHWAVKVGNLWIEVEGAGKGDSKLPMKIVFTEGSRSKSGIEAKNVQRLINPLQIMSSHLAPYSDVRLVGNTIKTNQVLFSSIFCLLS
jgi:hypothetical protein